MRNAECRMRDVSEWRLATGCSWIVGLEEGEEGGGDADKARDIREDGVGAGTPRDERDGVARVSLGGDGLDVAVVACEREPSSSASGKSVAKKASSERRISAAWS